jgi:UDP-N-acetylmuramate--alanine ligase
VECDHQDYYPDYESIRAAFIEYCRLLGEGGELIYCADDHGASDVARAVEKENRGIVLVPYGFSAGGDFRITSSAVKNERTIFTVSGFSSVDGERGGKVNAEEFTVQIPGVHQALNGTAALALTSILVKKECGWNGEKIRAVKEALGNFRGSKRRSEILGEAGGIIFMDDYGHHPTAIKATLAGLRSFYPARRIVISFMSHTYTRTAALLEDFASSFSDADILFLHKIYASAREVYSGGVTGMSLFEKTAERRAGKKESTFYIDEPLEAFEPAKAVLRPGDLFITMGAGNNRALCEKLFEYFKSASKR